MELEPYVGEPDVARLIGQIRGEPVDRVPHLEVLIEDKHVEKVLGRYAGNTLAVGGDPAKGAEEATGRPMYGKDYVAFNQAIGQDILLVECFWTPFKKPLREAESGRPKNDRPIDTSQVQFHTPKGPPQRRV